VSQEATVLAVIPARYASTRLPGKPLADICGRPMIQHVYERARRAVRPSRVVVATDDARIAAVVRGFGGEAIMTSPDHATGTDRLAEAARALACSLVVNVQGDEPLLDPAWIDAAVAPLQSESGVEMATLSLPLRSLGEMLSPSVVKVVCDGQGNALYFSRSPVPHVRLGAGSDLRAAAKAAVERGLARKHVGLYVYRRDTLLRLAGLPRAPLEEAEGLEQLRALHNGIAIRVVEASGEATIAVDTQGDLERVRALIGVQE
jgi:3-deoxy-manno-octulosonate cytidylyltransferase (CMP-KDO synthetase)